MTQVELATNSYVRHGGKKNRAQQRDRMLAFARFCRARGKRSMAEVGRRDVIEYWKACRGLSDATLRSHCYALRDLWDLFGLAGEVPEPWTKVEIEVRQKRADERNANSAES